MKTGKKSIMKIYYMTYRHNTCISFV